MRVLHGIIAASLLTLAACGGGEDASQAEAEPITGQEEPVSTEPTDDGSGDEGADDGCYVVSVDGQEGCWDSADEACDEVCGAPCVCTEATVNNTCGC